METFGITANTLTVFAVAFLISYYYHGVGITLGYHRILTHKSLKLPKWLEYLVVSGGYLGLMGSPIVWVAVHRLHHLKSDQPGDPHSPRDGFTHALVGWMFKMGNIQSHEDVKRICADMMKDPLYTKLGTNHTADQALLCLGLCIAFRVVLILSFGWAVAIANVAAAFTVFWSTQFVNTFCHMNNHGYRSFETREDSRNVWWVGILAVGEGWHNNHHALPKSAQHGLTAKEFDITWLTVLVLEKLGLAQDVVRPNLTALAARAIKKHAAPQTEEPEMVIGIGSKTKTFTEDVEDYNRSMLVGAVAGSSASAGKATAAAGTDR